MAQLSANGTQLHYQMMGEGPTLVMIHGLLLGNMATWYFGAATQMALTHQVLLYDLRGHGLSEQSSSGYDLSTMVGDLRALLDAHDLNNVALIGHSYGALIALRFALLYPERVSKLVLVEGPLPPSRGLQIEEFTAQTPVDRLKALPEQLQTMLSGKGRQSKKLLDRLQFLLTETDLLPKLKVEPDVDDEQLRQLPQATLLVYGRKSQLTEVATRLEQTLAHARLSWLDGGHYLPSELPLELGRIIGAFFS